MILTLDIGNSNIKIAIYDGEKRVQYARLATNVRKTSDEYGLQVEGIFQYAHLDRKMIDGIIISSVVPSLNYTLQSMCRLFFEVEPIFIGPGLKTGMAIRYDDPRQVGSDRIATAVGAMEKYGTPCIVIDFGTATTFGAVSAKGEFLGGAIMPGLKISLDSLVTQTSKLPTIELKKPRTVIGRNTVENMQSGLINGYIGAVERLLRKMREEMGEEKVTVVATGGMARMVADGSPRIFDAIDPYLTMDGLKIIYRKNMDERKEISDENIHK